MEDALVEWMFIVAKCEMRLYPISTCFNLGITNAISSNSFHVVIVPLSCSSVRLVKAPSSDDRLIGDRNLLRLRGDGVVSYRRLGRHNYHLPQRKSFKMR